MARGSVRFAASLYPLRSRSLGTDGNLPCVSARGPSIWVAIPLSAQAARRTRPPLPDIVGVPSVLIYPLPDIVPRARRPALHPTLLVREDVQSLRTLHGGSGGRGGRSIRGGHAAPACLSCRDRAARSGSVRRPARGGHQRTHSNYASFKSRSAWRNLITDRLRGTLVDKKRFRPIFTE